MVNQELSVVMSKEGNILIIQCIYRLSKILRINRDYISIIIRNFNFVIDKRYASCVMGSEASLQNWKRGISNFHVTTYCTRPDLPTLKPGTYIPVKNHSH